ncbi:hypothetical protein HC776_00735 [bacterium]|nr:hypothetical protein [bacterium]
MPRPPFLFLNRLHVGRFFDIQRLIRAAPLDDRSMDVRYRHLPAYHALHGLIADQALHGED